MTNETTIYKITPRAAWKEAEDQEVFKGAAIDLEDGYIHFSTAQQASETAAKHFKNEEDLLLVAVDTSQLGDALKWEVSRNNALFPHLYSSLDLKHVLWARPIPMGNDGVHILPLEAE